MRPYAFALVLLLSGSPALAVDPPRVFNSFAVFGDTPYTPNEAKCLQHDLDQLPNAADLSIHAGDIRSEVGPCDASSYSSVADILLSSDKPFFIVPGDNDFSSCGVLKGKDLWQQLIAPVNNHHGTPPDPQDQHPNNLAFTILGTLFLGLNTIDDAEARLHWVSSRLDNGANDPAIQRAVIFGHDHLQDLNAALSDIFRRFHKPILYINGHYHSFDFWHPCRDVKNLWCLQVDGGEDGHPPVIVTTTASTITPYYVERPTTICPFLASKE